jgi:hypothetical protein
MTIRSNNRSLYLAIGCACVVLTGCGPDYGDRVEVKGTIKLKGAPLDRGIIEFMPISGDRATQSGTVIANGSYAIPRESGLVPGKYRVIITAGDGRTPANASPDEAPGPTGANIVSRDRIPAEYNTNSKQQVEVTKKSPNVFDYSIP